MQVNSLSFDPDMRTKNIRRKHLEFLIFGLLTLAGMFGVARSIFTQDVVWVSNGLGWDGSHYDRLLKLLTGDVSLREPAAFPFCGRVGTPWILANIFLGRIDFYQFNLAISAIFSTLFVIVTTPLWRGNIKSLTAALALPSFLLFSPIRFTSFYPAYMDPPFLLLLTVALFFVIKGRYQMAAIMCLIAIPFREAGFYLIPLCVGFAVNEAKLKLRAVVCGLAIWLVGFAVKSLMLQVGSCEYGSQVKTAVLMFCLLFSDPTRFLDCLAALALTLGPLMFPKKEMPMGSQISDGRLQHFSLVAVFYVGLLSIVGGGDVTRIFYSFMPLYAPILISSFGRLDVRGFALACLGWLTTNQMLEKYAQPAAEWPNNDLTGFFAQFPDHAHPFVAMTILGTWLILRALYGLGGRFEDGSMSGNLAQRE